MSATIAAEVHYDVFVTSTGTGSKLVIGGFDDDALTATVPPEQMRVFGGEVFGTGTALPFESAGEPGFRAGVQSFLDGSATTPSGVYTALTGSTALAFTFQPMTIGSATRNLFFWDGAGAVNFAPVGGNVVLGLERLAPGPTWTVLINGTTSGIASGNTIQNTTAAGGVHTHLTTSLSQDGAAPQQGFYLFAMQLGMTGYTSSDPVFFVYGALDPDALAPQFADLAAFEAAHGLAESWVESSMLVPEPSTCILATAGIVVAMLLGRSHRRRREPSDRL
jgi:hypothetical protein